MEDRNDIDDMDDMDDMDDIDDINDLDYGKKRKKKIIPIKLIKNEENTINWLRMEEIQSFLKDAIESKETLLPRITQKWDSLNNVCDLKAVIADVKYR